MGLRNLSAGQLKSGISSSDTSLTLESGQGAIMPTTPFYATLAPFAVLANLLNSEIIKVTDVTSDTLTIERGKRNTTPFSFSKGDVLSAGIYVEDLGL